MQPEAQKLRTHLRGKLVFISYRHEPKRPKHRKQVAKVADRLREQLGQDGVTVECDCFYGPLSHQWPRWCADNLNAADLTLVIVSRGYVKATERKAIGLRTGRGAAFEAYLIRTACSLGQWEKFRGVYFKNLLLNVPLEISAIGTMVMNPDSATQVDRLVDSVREQLSSPRRAASGALPRFARFSSLRPVWALVLCAGCALATGTLIRYSFLPADERQNLAGAATQFFDHLWTSQPSPAPPVPLPREWSLTASATQSSRVHVTGDRGLLEPGHQLWLVVEPQSMSGMYWPMQSVTIKDGRWEATAYLGDASTRRGEAFRLMLIDADPVLADAFRRQLPKGFGMVEPGITKLRVLAEATVGI